MLQRLGRLVAVAALLAVPPVACGSDAYLLGPEDVVSISVWERPDLTRTVAIRIGGEIAFPPLGELPAAGKTAAALARQIEERLNEFLRRPTQVTVEVVEFNSQRVTVSGAVVTPGRLSFETIPGLLEVLGTAGGLGPEADLSRVQIFRTATHQRATITVDLSEAMLTGDLSSLPDLESHDVIFVPGVGAGAAQSGAVAYVTGHVGAPGAYGVGRGLDLFKLLSISGGNLPTADLSRVQVIAHDPSGESFAATVDLERLASSGRSDFLVRPGDIVHVPERGGARTSVAWSVTREVLGVSRDILNLFLISDVLNQN